MLRSWKVFGLALVFGLSVVLLLPRDGSVTSPSRALADHAELVIVEVETPSSNFDFVVTMLAGTPCTGTLVDIDDEESQSLTCAGDSDVEVDWVNVAGFVLASISCNVDAGEDGAVAGVQSTIIDPDPEDGDVVVQVRDNEHIRCLFTFTTGGTTTPTVTGTPPTATPTGTTTPQVSAVTVSIAPSTLACNGSAFVTVVARNAGGAVIASGPVTLQTNLGTISPTSATDQGAGVLAVLTAPSSQGGTATVQVVAGGVSGSAQATINCAQATSVPPTSVPPTVAPVTGILPPSTGDAGLAGNADGRVYAGLALLAFVLAGGVSLARSRARS